MSEFKLRPHHSLCIQFFIGNGYSKEFTENMYKTIELLKSNPVIQIVCQADNLCVKCPNLAGNDCINSNEGVAEIDKKVMEICGFSDKDKISAKEFFTRSKENIINAGRMKEVCGGCLWSDICLKYNRW
jgi:hypothetical protein